MNYKYFTSPPLIFMSKRQTINVTFVSLMSTIILLFTQSHASPKPCVGCHHSWDLQLLSKGGPASTIRRGTQAVIGWRYLRTYWPQIKPSQSRNSNTINECGVRRETGDWPHAPPWPRSRVWEWELDSDNSRHWIWHVTRDVMSRRMSSGTNQHWFAYRPCHRCLITSFCSTPSTQIGINGKWSVCSAVRYLDISTPSTSTQICGQYTDLRSIGFVKMYSI